MRGLGFVGSSIVVRRAVQPVVEQLESRQLRDASLVNGIITVTGTDAVDIVVISVDPDAAKPSLFVAFNDQTGLSRRDLYEAALRRK